VVIWHPTIKRGKPFPRLAEIPGGWCSHIKVKGDGNADNNKCPKNGANSNILEKYQWM